ncbi:undecaprenyldiphospho-muramoylpentapeptide beta-N-acetylglucosaminyltransferase [Capnocytophaga catalasegens]|uniref:UDP-N-acetylglucosamine--N-acetylmuramyl-(pentapeptide) pyrophosphoryl-undecaprenol N-acetylglucosamine transferase n=1 Tax=Capnocytophaga catalasegens TaxID=1004260 RepID=A0AAV5AS08_9FLAO|nr:undecaprenyldiphospho-muramoylpentapeptide beta-N-acetylglucosaminyltransferase [Capnocytophaga catalasegens]GIZ15741.1 UDP-N-acetylglucosamine--N-acetylmuramyl-(pentapeptide) pyrophosphoryl-undecaprenol N-acetylglucosamine transferase [Capnocytophaga catalasegens]GJM50128.1 UDP-N-acetylglucosamine--N-acetylmuramyl-(pentapeptide) pyrophosphoryl-undecaprenol N-acetylglucosamine transferase [Capnocytophaga catalasegens]GJM53047.1 UDP-N-acetylglucosamine--N-acetylmuramyl-(pentapeptide) pyrophosp
MKKFIISGGGTGGHIYPAIAIADELKRRYPEAQFLFVGAKGRMEMQKVPEAGYAIEGLWISGLQRKLTWDNLFFPLKLVSSLWKAWQIIKKFRPDVVIGTGGYASAPMLKMAQWTGIPYFIQEQNSLAGVTNKWIAKGAEKIFVAYQGMERFFPKEKIFLTGNPVRQDLLQIEAKREQAFAHFSLQKEKPTLLVLGGSLGARAINQLIENQLDLFEKSGIQVLWQCGKMYYEIYKKYDNQNVRVLPFVRKIDQAYALSDVIISRAGASSVSELCIVGKPVIFIPSPNVAEDHQTKNAQAIAQHNAAILIKENELTARFVSEFSELIFSLQKQKSLSEEIKKLALPNATQTIVNEIVMSIENTKL